MEKDVQEVLARHAAEIEALSKVVESQKVALDSMFPTTIAMSIIVVALASEAGQSPGFKAAVTKFAEIIYSLHLASAIPDDVIQKARELLAQMLPPHIARSL